MRRVLVLTAGVPLFALGGAYVVFAIWDRLIRSEIVSNGTLSWFPTIAILWGCACIAAGVYFFKSEKKHATRRKRK